MSGNWQQLQCALNVADEDKICAECNFAQPTHASLNIGVYICEDCAVYHRKIFELGNFGEVVVPILSHNWTKDQLSFFRDEAGNARVNREYENSLPVFYHRPNRNDPAVLREQWLEAKYKREEFQHLSQLSYSEDRIGTLFKRLKGSEKFLRRKFILSESKAELLYYIKASDQRPKDAISIQNIVNIYLVPNKVQHPNGMQLTFWKDGMYRNMFLYGDDGKTTTEWYHAIRSAMTRHKYQRLSMKETKQLLNDHIILEGWVNKTGPRKQEKFRRRWLSMIGSRMWYFGAKLDAYPLGVIVLGSKNFGYGVSKGSPTGVKIDDGYGFTIHTPDRVYVLSCSGLAGRNEWVEAIEKELDKCSTFPAYASKSSFSKNVVFQNAKSSSKNQDDGDSNNSNDVQHEVSADERSESQEGADTSQLFTKNSIGKREGNRYKKKNKKGRCANRTLTAKSDPRHTLHADDIRADGDDCSLEYDSDYVDFTDIVNTTSDHKQDIPEKEIRPTDEASPPVLPIRSIIDSDDNEDERSESSNSSSASSGGKNYILNDTQDGDQGGNSEVPQENKVEQLSENEPPLECESTTSATFLSQTCQEDVQPTFVDVWLANHTSNSFWFLVFMSDVSSHVVESYVTPWAGAQLVAMPATVGPIRIPFDIEVAVVHIAPGGFGLKRTIGPFSTRPGDVWEVVQNDGNPDQNPEIRLNKERTVEDQSVQIHSCSANVNKFDVAVYRSGRKFYTRCGIKPGGVVDINIKSTIYLYATDEKTYRDLKGDDIRCSEILSRTSSVDINFIKRKIDVAAKKHGDSIVFINERSTSMKCQRNSSGLFGLTN